MIASVDDCKNYKNFDKYVPQVHLGKVFKCYDGDTISVLASIAEDRKKLYRFSVRIRGVDTPEIRTKDPIEKYWARRAQKMVENLVLHRNVTLSEVALDKYGRILANIECAGVDLATAVIKAKLGRAYDGGMRTKIDWEEFCAPSNGPSGLA